MFILLLKPHDIDGFKTMLLSPAHVYIILIYISNMIMVVK